MTTRKSGLGKNINVFLSKTKSIQKTTDTENSSETLKKLSVKALQPGAYQPRKDMTQQALSELADSIKQQGLLQPIVARPVGEEQFEIIAGERRWRASQLAGLIEVPVIVHDVDNKTSLAMALVENIQREDLNPMEEARALSRLIKEFELTHQQASEVVAKSRTSITNLLRLMNLHPSVQLMLENGDIEMGHARALLALEDHQQVEMARKIIEENFNVRETEAAIRNFLNPAAAKQSVMPISTQLRHYTKQSQKQLAQTLEGKVKVKPMSSGKIKVEIVYDDKESLERFLGQVG